MAERRQAEDCEAYQAAQALQLASAERLGDETPGATPGPHQMGLPSPQALQKATDVICRNNVLPETGQHPALQAASMELAYRLMAYGLDPAGQDFGQAQPAIPERRKRGQIPTGAEAQSRTTATFWWWTTPPTCW